MKTILTIGYDHFLLPSSVNVNSLLQALSKAEPLERKFGGHKELFIRKNENARVSVQVVPDREVIDHKKPKQIPEQASPDAHNTFGPS